MSKWSTNKTRKMPDDKTLCLIEVIGGAFRLAQYRRDYGWTCATRLDLMYSFLSVVRWREVEQSDIDRMLRGESLPGGQKKDE